MKTVHFILAAGGLVISLSGPAVAQDFSNGGGFTNLWSSAQGTAFTYGAANAFGNSSSGSTAQGGGGGGLKGLGSGGVTSAITTSQAGTVSTGGGYAQAQTSGYAGGSVSGSSARGH